MKRSRDACVDRWSLVKYWFRIICLDGNEVLTAALSDIMFYNGFVRDWYANLCYETIFNSFCLFFHLHLAPKVLKKIQFFQESWIWGPWIGVLLCFCVFEEFCQYRTCHIGVLFYLDTYMFSGCQVMLPSEFEARKTIFPMRLCCCHTKAFLNSIGYYFSFSWLNAHRWSCPLRSQICINEQL